ncbi:UNVERIFIED_CONTAM: hypothetical protein Sangu_2985000 [Sesamum angustifolium]|uniref:DUF4218 domain-containing protein n=1 Tax=Sesamum angustifolium TaxID=2727405 RepID=A0AAW2IJS1_9LAMI
MDSWPKVSDGYASNLACCVDMTELWMHGMKNYDCHVFMRLILHAALTEVSLLFQTICSIMLDVHKLHELENTVAIIMYNLEKIFLPTFFDSMKHLIVHLPYEARLGGPV